MRKIAVIIGSKSDFSQCLEGLKFLQDFIKESPDEIQVVGVYVRSQHRNTYYTQELIRELTGGLQVDVAIIGAGWANALTGCCDAFENYALHSARMAIIGVGFENFDNDPEVRKRRNDAAILSMTEVPGTQAICHDSQGVFFGDNGFLRACHLAVEEELPKRRLDEPKLIMDLSLEEAIAIAVQ